MAKSAPFTKEEIIDLKDRLNKLNRASITAFSTRCALRVFPLLAHKVPEKSYFFYWPEEDRVKHLLGVWHLLLGLSTNEKSGLDFSSRARLLRHRADFADFAAAAAASAASAVSASSSVAVSVAAAAVSAAAVSAASARAVAVAAAAVSAASARAVAALGANLKDDMLKDLMYLEQGEGNVFLLPLLRSIKEDSNLSELVSHHLPSALTLLSTGIQSQDPQGAAIIDSIYPLYQGLFHGKPDQDSIQKALNKIEGYLNLIKIEAGHSHSNHQLAKEDKLDRKKLVETLADLLQAPDNSHHQTIGLLGHWGVGKSSVVELLKTSLKNRVEHRRLTGRAILDKGLVHEPMEPMPEFLFAEFNAWEYEHTDNLQAGIAQEMIKTLSSPEPNTNTRLGKVVWMFRRFGLTLRFALSLHSWKFIRPLMLFLLALAPFWVPDEVMVEVKGFFSSLFGEGTSPIVPNVVPAVWTAAFFYSALKQSKTLFVGPLAKELLTYLKLPNYGKHLGTIPVMRDHIKKLTKVRLKEDQRILYVVDDLDRCGHKGIVKVLEAVRMVLDLDKVVVVIAVDQRIALAALALHYKDLASQHHIEDPRLIARDYLAKIIHLPIVLTEPNDAAVVGYLSHLWDDESWLDTLPLYKNGQKSQNGTKEQSETRETPIETEGEPDRDNVMAESNNSESLAGSSEIREEDSSLSNHQAQEAQEQEEQVITRIVSLSDEQKWAFKHWLTHFELSNPRQIKRLHNSYTFLRNFYPQGERMEGSKKQDGSETFPMMVTLFALEYLNNLNDITKRQQLRTLLSSDAGLDTLEEAENQDASNNGDPKESSKIINAYVIELANCDLNGISMTKAIEPFVLPGIDVKSDDVKPTV